MIPKDPRHFLRPIRWSIALFLILGLLLSQWLLPGEEQRWTFRFLLLALGAYWFAMTQYFMPRYWVNQWMIYANCLITNLVIAISGYLIKGLDVSPLYMMVILATGMVWDRRAALFSATLSSTLIGLVALSSGAVSPPEIASHLLDVAGYFATALLVTQLSYALTKRWQMAAADAEQRRHEVAHRKDELEGLYRIAQAFGNLEDADATFRQATEHIARFVGAKICAIAILSPESAQLQGMPPGYGISDESIQTFRFPADDEDRAHPLETFKRDFVLFNDLTHLTSSIIKFAAVQNIRNFVTARMMLYGRPTGLILLANKISGDAFEEEDGRLLSILASQAAIAIENVRLYRQAQENLVDMTRLYAISAQLASSSEPSEIPELVVQTLTEALNASSASIALLNESTSQLEYAARANLPDEFPRTPFRENGVSMTVLRTGKARFIEDELAANDVNPAMRASGYRATACLPIQHGAHAWGVLYVNYPEPHVFTPFEKNMLAIFANQVSIALETAKLLRVERRRLVDLAALTNLSHSLAETMDLAEMFRVFEQQVRAEIPTAEGGVLLIYDAVRDVLIPRASFGYDREILERVALHPGESAAGKVYQTNQPVRLNGQDAVKQARRDMQPDNQALLAAAASVDGVPHSLISAPLRASGETLGSIVLDNSHSAQAFTPDDLQFLSAMADLIALSIHNAQLYAREQRRAAQLTTVNDLGHRVSSILEMSQLEQTLVRLIRDKFGYRYVHLFINDPQKNATVLRAGAGSLAAELVSGVFALQSDQGMVGWTAAHGETLLANDVSKEPHFHYHPAVPDTRSEISIPLVVSARVIGALDIQSEHLNAFDPTDVATLETLASQIAIAIENARLYGETQEQARRDSLTQACNHGYFLERLGEEVTRAHTESKSLALIMLDVDYFKEYNDAYGHVIGDHVLALIVQAIRAHVKRTDIVGRWGGEEFCIALPENDASGALRVAERIRQTLLETQLEGKDGAAIPPPTVSQGIACYPAHAQDAAGLIDRADATLYRAKAAGRDQVQVWSATHPPAEPVPEQPARH